MDIRSIEGQITPDEINRLQHLASLVPEHGLIVEVGAFRGRSTAALASGSKDSVTILSIDPWCLQGKSQQGYETLETMNAYRRNIDPWQQKIIQVVAFPVEFARMFNAPIDLLFVDCVKDYERLFPIWRAYAPHCRGWIASHDCKPVYPDVVRIVDEYLKPNTTQHNHVDWLWSGRVKNDLHAR